MANFGELQTQVQDAIIDLPTVTINQIPNFIRQAIRKLQRKHNFKVMEAQSGLFTTTLHTRSIGAVPTNFKEFRGRPMEVSLQGRVRRLAIAQRNEEALAMFGWEVAGGGIDPATIAGRPMALGVSPSSDEAGVYAFHVFPLPDGLSLFSGGEYRIVVPYYRYLTPLSAAGDTNWFTTNAEEWAVQQAAAFGFFHDHDEERGTLWTQRAATEYKDILLADKYFRLSGFETLVPYMGAAGPFVDIPDTWR